jgi:23S rRNA (uracil1939-C5)-methyltransferase
VGRVEDVIPELAPADAAIVNPPRSGLGPEVTDALLARPPAQLAYVSCDPATLARDLARMSSAYRLVSVRAFDSFPQTAHVETVVALRNRG